MIIVKLDGYNYAVSDDGQVFSLHGEGLKPVKFGTANHGYKLAYLNRDGVKSTRKVHRLVAEVFLGHSPLHVNHKNGDKLDNRIENLEYCTRSENMQHAWKYGLCESVRAACAKKNRLMFGEKHPSSKLTDSQVLEILDLKGKMSQAAVGKLFGVSQTCIGLLWRGKRRKDITTEV